MAQANGTRMTVLAAITAGLVLAFDLYLPLGGFADSAVAVPYVAMVLLGLWFPAPRHVCYLAAAATALTIVGYVASPPGGDTWVVLANRGLALFAVWITAALIAGRKTAEAALTEAKARAERYLEVSEAMIVALDVRGRITAINRRGCDILLYSEREMVGQDWFTTCLPPEQRHAVRGMFDQMMAGEIAPIEHFENEVLARDGKRRFMAWHNTPVHGPGGAITGTLSSGLDITERKQAEAELIAARQEAEHANRAKTDFLASMSHELRTPLNAVLGFAELLRYDAESALSERQDERVGYIIKGGNHLLYLIDQVLELNKIEFGHLSLTLEAVEPWPLVADCLPLVRARAEEAGVRLQDRTVAGDMPMLWTDAARLKQVLLNLLSNGVKYNRKGGEVVLSATPVAGGMLRFIINDTGLGIPADRQADLFTPFDRLGRETANIEGTGIGLSISRQIVESLGGRIGFASEEGKGSSFWIDVPLFREEREALPATSDGMIGVRDCGPEQTPQSRDSGPAAQAHRPAAQAEMAAQAFAGEPRTVLYLEDDPESQQLMQAILDQIPGVHMIPAHTAELGLDLASRHQPDMVLMDIGLPGLNGIEALGQLRSLEGLGAIPAIAVSAAARPEEVKAGLDAGFKAYLTKPLDVRKTLRIIGGLL